MFAFPRPHAAALLALSAALLAPAARAAGADDDALIRRAFVYSFPIHEMGRLLLAGGGATAAPRFNHRRTLATPAERTVTTPNNDTLNSTARLNLALGPVRLTVPDTGGRYYSIALIDASSDNFAMVGRRTTGTRAGEFIIVGPDWISPLPEGARVIRAPANDVLVLLRLLVESPADLPVAQRVQDGFTVAAVQPPAGRGGAATPKPDPAPAGAPPATAAANGQPSPAERYLALVNRMLSRNPPPSYERPLLEQFAAVGVCGAACSWESLGPALQARWAALLPEMMSGLERRAREMEQRSSGWSRPRAAVGNFGTAYELRAVVALTGLLALEPAEAMYFMAREDGAHRPLEGTRVYRLHLPRGAMPVDAFWSLTMYEKDFDGRLFLAANQIGRAAIGDRTPGLRRNGDGSVDIWIQRANPGRAKSANWLPAPPGPFVLTLRAYQPRSELLDGRFAIPAVERIE